MAEYKPIDTPCPRCNALAGQSCVIKKGEWKGYPHGDTHKVRADLHWLAINARAEEYRAALEDIAQQQLTSEKERIDGEIQGDFEYAYDKMIEVARDALRVT